MINQMNRTGIYGCTKYLLQLVKRNIAARIMKVSSLDLELKQLHFA